MEMTGIIIGIVLDVVVWRILLMLGVAPATAEIVLILLLLLTILGGGIYIGTSHHILA
jgi:protein-S-isoprenylcysteine O-methyltransferase Ste14